jgi:hypothetical protein
VLVFGSKRCRELLYPKSSTAYHQASVSRYTLVHLSLGRFCAPNRHGLVFVKQCNTQNRPIHGQGERNGESNKMFDFPVPVLTPFLPTPPHMMQNALSSEIDPRQWRSYERTQCIGSMSQQSIPRSTIHSPPHSHAARLAAECDAPNKTNGQLRTGRPFFSLFRYPASRRTDI